MQSIPIVGCEPICVTILVDDQRDLCLGTGFLGWLNQEARLSARFGGRDCEAWFHSHCHERTVCGTQGTRAPLMLFRGFQVQETDAGCCGMAGAFGYRREHFGFSLQVGEGRLFAAVREAPVGAELVLTGACCRDQICYVTGRRPRHPIELLAEAVPDA
jgi:Fe-S oxidoreductase